MRVTVERKKDWQEERKRKGNYEKRKKGRKWGVLERGFAKMAAAAFFFFIYL